MQAPVSLLAVAGPGGAADAGLFRGEEMPEGVGKLAVTQGIIAEGRVGIGTGRAGVERLLEKLGGLRPVRRHPAQQIKQGAVGRIGLQVTAILRGEIHLRVGQDRGLLVITVPLHEHRAFGQPGEKKRAVILGLENLHGRAEDIFIRVKPGLDHQVFAGGGIAELLGNQPGQRLDLDALDEIEAGLDQPGRA